jgi:hypothetical protein
MDLRPLLLVVLVLVMCLVSYAVVTFKKKSNHILKISRIWRALEQMRSCCYAHLKITAADAVFSQYSFRADFTEKHHRRLFWGAFRACVFAACLAATGAKCSNLLPILGVCV